MYLKTCICVIILSIIINVCCKVAFQIYLPKKAAIHISVKCMQYFYFINYLLCLCSFLISIRIKMNCFRFTYKTFIKRLLHYHYIWIFKLFFMRWSFLWNLAKNRTCSLFQPELGQVGTLIWQLSMIYGNIFLHNVMWKYC